MRKPIRVGLVHDGLGTLHCLVTLPSGVSIELGRGRGWRAAMRDAFRALKRYEDAVASAYANQTMIEATAREARKKRHHG